jgi:alkanesulfonate monooxygenase SsuD/methylene tetrahydromethanopterin reductase-like flavin-dependent oxidoreductase (luciferase family)
MGSPETMKVAIGLPNAVAGTTGEQITGFARRAEERGFSSLGTIDRIVYDNYDPFIALSAAASVTERIGLATTVCIAPPRNNDVLVAKQALSVQALSGGRLTYAAGLGGRDDDYEASDVPTSGKGERFEQHLDTVKRVFDGEKFGFAGAIGPRAEQPPPIVVAGHVEASFERAARFDGWIMGGGTPDQFKESAEGVRAAWSEAGRDGEPYLASLAYYSLGPDAEKNADEKIGGYYAVLGDEVAGMIAGSAAKDADTVAQYTAAFEDAGCQELFFFPADGDPEQVDLLAEAAAL